MGKLYIVRYENRFSKKTMLPNRMDKLDILIQVIETKERQITNFTHLLNK